MARPMAVILALCLYCFRNPFSVPIVVDRAFPRPPFIRSMSTVSMRHCDPQKSLEKEIFATSINLGLQATYHEKKPSNPPPPT